MPPRDQDFVELLPFEIPETLRKKVGKARCPICSPLKGKYFAGCLAWFPEEGVLRAIGHECAKSHFGALRYNEAVAAGRHQREVDRAQDFLLDALPQLAPVRNEVGELEDVARSIDSVRKQFWSRVTKDACKKLAQLGRDGILAVNEHRSVAVVDRYGRERTSMESRQVATYRVRALGFLTRQFLVLAHARNTMTRLNEIPVANDDEQALEVVCDLLKSDTRLLATEDLVRSALRDVQKLRQAVAEAKEFLSAENLSTLAEWSSDDRADAPAIIEFNRRYPAFVGVYKPGGKGSDIRIPDNLID